MSARSSSLEGGFIWLTTFVVGSAEARFNTAIKTHAQASPAQIRRLGRTSSRHKAQPAASSRLSFESPRSQTAATDGASDSFHIRSSFGSTVWCRFNKISRGVLMYDLPPTIFLAPVWHNA